MPAQRIILAEPPFQPGPQAGLWERGVWPARWIQPDGAPAEGVVLWLARLIIDLPHVAVVRIHVTADERYDLSLDGERIGRGPERGDIDHWPFESFDLTLAAGTHQLLARTWHLGSEHAPTAQLSVHAGFLLAAEGEHAGRFATGTAPWQTHALGGHQLVPGATHDTGSRLLVHTADVHWPALAGQGDGWTPAVATRPGIDGHLCSWWHRHWRLVPAALPAMRQQPLALGVLRHLQALVATDLDLSGLPVFAHQHLAPEAGAWAPLLAGQALSIPARTSRRAIIDLGAYHCAYTTVTVRGGAGSALRLHWTEALWEPQILTQGWPFESRAKGQRDVIEGKVFRGQGDAAVISGGGPHRIEGLWWSAGRYLELVVHTGAEALVIERLVLTETGYPWQVTGRFACDDPSLAGIEELAIRTLRACTHETFMDCPYYEQMQYIGDTRLQALVGYVLSPDDRLVRKALAMFDASRFPEGLTRSRYPVRDPQVIPGFSLWWVAMVHDHARWRDDLPFIRSLMPGVRMILECFRVSRRDDDLVACPEGWNFLDWVPTWDAGQSPGGAVSASLQWHLAGVLGMVAELEEALHEPELAMRNRAWAQRLSQQAWSVFWDAPSQRLADDREHRRFSEHAPALALISGCLTPEQQRLAAASLSGPGPFEPVTIYFAHYLFEAYRVMGRGDLVLARLDLWRALPARGLTTLIETPEPNRSDCHAWGAHPVFHFRASLLGVRPSGLGFRSLTISPSLGALTTASARIPHPRGEVLISLERSGPGLSGEIELPPGTSGELLWCGSTLALHAGRQQVQVAAL